MTIRVGDGTHLARARVLAEDLSRVLAIALGAGLSVVGWMVMFSGAWRIGLWIELLSAGIVSVVLWDVDAERD